MAKLANSVRWMQRLRVSIAFLCVFAFAAPLSCAAFMLPGSARVVASAPECHPCCPPSHPAQARLSCCSTSPDATLAQAPIMGTAAVSLHALHCVASFMVLPSSCATSIASGGTYLAPPRLIALRV
jgi:hypothetical protein